MTFQGRYEADGLNGTTSTVGVAHLIRPSQGTSPLRGWLAKLLGPPGHPAAVAHGVDRLVVILSAAAVVPVVTGRSHCSFAWIEGGLTSMPVNLNS